ncbi:Metallo-dependent phosphatase-like protein [Crassisporium funariophilum]|nr:Metallo-dependent phosphatase-like protein [Crassisporium funariophilum]
MAVFARRRLIVNALRILWVLLTVWYEYGIFMSTAWVCNWPDATLYPVSPTHVLLVADPQILDQHSYPGRGALLSWLTRIVVDLNLRKNWHAALHKQPDVVVFLGDMMDNGRLSMSDEEYESYYERFRDIFKPDKDIPHHFIPGNHDIGLGLSTSFSPYAYARYVSHFGSPNYVISVANHSLVLLDAPGYADEDSKRHGQRKSFEKWGAMPGGALEFMKKFAAEKQTDPVVLLSHIPLYRSDGKGCGPLRERGTLRPGVGHGYQNTLEKHSTQRLLEALIPTAVFSGDDHDYCDYTHQLRFPDGPPRSIQEITVKTLSMVMNVRRPGFQLLSLAPAELRTDDTPTYDHTPCLLPDQLHIYLNVYLPILAISLLIVFLSNLIRSSRAYHDPTSPVSYQQPTSYAKSRDSADLDDQHDGELLSPYYTSTFQGLPSPISAVNQSKRYNPRQSSSPFSNWTFTLQGQKRRLAYDPKSLADSARNVLSFFCPGISQQSGLHRRGWFGASIRDVRDIAIFPLGIFILITWWVVTK